MRIVGSRAVATNRVTLPYAFGTVVDGATRVLAETTETNDAGHDQSRGATRIASYRAANE